MHGGTLLWLNDVIRTVHLLGFVELIQVDWTFTRLVPYSLFILKISLAVRKKSDVIIYLLVFNQLDFFHMEDGLSELQGYNMNSSNHIIELEVGLIPCSQHSCNHMHNSQNPPQILPGT